MGKGRKRKTAKNDVSSDEESHEVGPTEAMQSHEQQKTPNVKEKEDQQKTNDESEHSDTETAEVEVDGDQGNISESATAVKKRRNKKLEQKAVDDFNAKLRKRGVLYVARIPPGMTPSGLKTKLSELGEITRMHCTQEKKWVRKRRKRQGGNGSRRYVEAWFEFASKKVAKRVGMALNNTPMSNNKRSRHHGDLWNVRFLRKFTWDHLTERMMYERAMRDQKLTVEMMQAKRENASYALLVEKGRKRDKIEESRKKRAKKRGEDYTQPATLQLMQKMPVEDKDRSSSGAVLQSLV